MVSHFKKPRSKRYTVKNVTDADYADNQALLANTPAQIESLLPILPTAYPRASNGRRCPRRECQ